MEECPFPEKKKYSIFSSAFMDAWRLNRHASQGNPYTGAYECGDHFHVGRLWQSENKATQAQLNQRVGWLRKEIGEGLDFEQVAQILLELFRQGGRSGRRILEFWQRIPPARYKPNGRHRRRRDRWNPLHPHPKPGNYPSRYSPPQNPDNASAPEV